jgi:hypothetical protein
MSKAKIKVTEKTSGNLFDRVDSKLKYIISVAAILIALINLFSPYLFDNLRPTGSDVVASKGETKLYLDWQNSTGEKALWNPNIFGGMPIYARIIPQIIHFDTLINFLNSFVYWAFLYFFVGAIGLFFLLVYKKIPWYVGVIISIAFILLPDWQALLGDGHYTKLRAIMVLPWVVLTFSYFFERKSWFSAVLFGFIYSWMFRTQHFQIVFYSILMLAFLYIYPFVKLFVEKKFKEGLMFIIKLIAALILTVVTSAQPFLSIKEYAPYSTRGGNPIEMDEKQSTARESGGVSLDYAIQWSLAPAEVFDFFIQRFHGGLSGETYDGDKYPEYKGQRIPGYWGQKPFSGNYHYFGITLFIFALIGAITYRRDYFVSALTVFSGFTILLSFGEDLTWLYKLFYYYVPFFSKFRAPSMIANITFISLLILAAYGIKGLLEKYSVNNSKQIFIILGAAIAFGVGVYLFKDSFSYLAKNDLKIYKPEVISILKEMRAEFLAADTIKMIVTVIILSAVIIAYLFRKIRTELFIVILLAIVFTELYSANKRASEKIELNEEVLVEENVFKENDITNYLKNQTKDARLLVLGREFQSNHYSYFYPTINGYSAIKMQTIQDANDYLLFGANTPENINWNFINMLGGKFIIADGMINKPFLTPKAYLNDPQQVLFENSSALPKAWFVRETKTLGSEKEIMMQMKDTSFSPLNTALLLNHYKINKFSGVGSVKPTAILPNKISFDCSTDSDQFMVVSEMFYPKGWIATIDKRETEIVKTNIMLRGIFVPAGKHKVEFVFQPETYFAAVKISWAGNIVSLFLLISLAYFEFFKGKNK